MGIQASLMSDNKRLVIKLDNKFDYGKVQDFRRAYDDLPDSVKQIDVDLEDTEYMDSSALGMLLNMHKTLSGRGIEFHLKNCRPQVERVLMISRFDKKFIIG